MLLRAAIENSLRAKGLRLPEMPIRTFVSAKGYESCMDDRSQERPRPNSPKNSNNKQQQKSAIASPSDGKGKGAQTGLVKNSGIPGPMATAVSSRSSKRRCSSSSSSSNGSSTSYSSDTADTEFEAEPAEVTVKCKPVRPTLERRTSGVGSEIDSEPEITVKKLLQLERDWQFEEAKAQNLPRGTIFVRDVSTLPQDWKRPYYKCTPDCEYHKSAAANTGVRFAQEMEREKSKENQETRILPPPRWKFRPQNYTNYFCKHKTYHALHPAELAIFGVSLQRNNKQWNGKRNIGKYRQWFDNPNGQQSSGLKETASSSQQSSNDSSATEEPSILFPLKKKKRRSGKKAKANQMWTGSSADDEGTTDSDAQKPLPKPSPPRRKTKAEKLQEKKQKNEVADLGDYIVFEDEDIFER